MAALTSGRASSVGTSHLSHLSLDQRGIPEIGIGFERAARKAVKAREELRQAILLARASGEIYADIATAAGLSPQRIAQIVQGR